MSTPAPRFPSTFMGKTFLQKGGPVSVSSGATSAAVTFGDPFPDTDYQIGIDWVSGSTPGYGARGKTVQYFTAVFTQVTTQSAFQWRAWRIV